MKRLIRSPHFLPILTISVLVLAVYVRTMPPGLTWEHYGYDAGDLISCVYTWGIPHPPGTPLYVLVGQIFRVFPFFKNPAAKFNFMSVVFGWLSLVVAYFASLKITGNRLASFVATLFLAFTPLFWGQSIIAEVLTLNLFLVSLSTYFLISWERSDVLGNREDRFLYLSIFSFGLALTNHTSSLMLAPAILFMVFSVAPELLRRRRGVSKVVLSFLLGLSPYIYLPLRAVMRPPLNWGDPSNLSRFISHVTAREYQGLLFVVPRLFLDNAVRFVNSVWKNFNPLGFLLLALGFFFGKKDRVRDFLIFSSLFQLLFIFNYNIVNIETYYLPVFFNGALLLAEGCLQLGDLFSGVKRWVEEKNLRSLARLKLFWRKESTEITFGAAAAFLLGFFLVVASSVNVFWRWKEVDLHDERKADDYGRGVFEVLEPESIVLAEGDEFFLGLLYFKHVVFPERTDVAIFHAPSLFYKLSWVLEQARRDHPHLNFPRTNSSLDEEEAGRALMEFIELNRGEHPIYLAVGEEPLKVDRASQTVWGDRYVVRSTGPLYKIIGEKEEGY